MSWLGIDIGTTGAKAVVFDQGGKTLASAYREYGVLSPQMGWFELDCAEVMEVCREVIAAAAGQVLGSDAVRAIGISSQGEAFTLLDKRGRYLCNAMVSFDTRSARQVADFAGIFGAEALYRITGHSPHTLFSVFKLLWIKQNRPEIFERIDKFLCMGDLLGYELTGCAQISYNLAARTMLFDVDACQWSVPILDSVGVDEYIFSRAVAADTAIGTVQSQLAKELKLSKNCIVAAGGHDQSCGGLGVGAVEPGMAAYSSGTVECITPVFAECVMDETMRRSNLATYPHVADGLYTTVAFTTTGGSGLKWFRDMLGQSERQKAEQEGLNVYDLLLEGMPAEPTQLLVLPHFTSTGTPYFDAHPTSAIFGIDLTTRKGDLLKGLLEGIAFEMKLNLELLRQSEIAVQHLRAFGGGTKSSISMQLKADILNTPIEVMQVTEAGCLGSAILAAKAAGQTEDVKACVQRWVKPARRFEPDAKRAVFYTERYGLYGQLYEKTKAAAIGSKKTS